MEYLGGMFVWSCCSMRGWQEISKVISWFEVGKVGTK